MLEKAVQLPLGTGDNAMARPRLDLAVQQEVLMRSPVLFDCRNDKQSCLLVRKIT